MSLPPVHTRIPSAARRPWTPVPALASPLSPMLPLNPTTYLCPSPLVQTDSVTKSRATIPLRAAVPRAGHLLKAHGTRDGRRISSALAPRSGALTARPVAEPTMRALRGTNLFALVHPALLSVPPTKHIVYPRAAPPPPAILDPVGLLRPLPLAPSCPSWPHAPCVLRVAARSMRPAGIARSCFDAQCHLALRARMRLRAGGKTQRQGITQSSPPLRSSLPFTRARRPRAPSRIHALTI
ncbi:hypothetical protein B0H15DRAFT_957020 [Mycena belliarum]|uniref:Uncharacterized protein n=1 Tax=Mycena belliarum TaxID=1033014 RepID=A0AAD6XH25_9AGAR|nr:hypothetical protein B0H15DRAFT_957020 [Mycena belliae]